MADLCPEPRSTGDLYLLDGKTPVTVGGQTRGCWFLDGVPNTAGTSEMSLDWHGIRDRLTLLARREDVGRIVLAAMRWADFGGDKDPGLEERCRGLMAAVRAAKENARA